MITDVVIHQMNEATGERGVVPADISDIAEVNDDSVETGDNMPPTHTPGGGGEATGLTYTKEKAYLEDDVPDLLPGSKDDSNDEAEEDSDDEEQEDDHLSLNNPDDYSSDDSEAEDKINAGKSRSDCECRSSRNRG